MKLESHIQLSCACHLHQCQTHTQLEPAHPVQAQAKAFKTSVAAQTRPMHKVTTVHLKTNRQAYKAEALALHQAQVVGHNVTGRD
jgi:hypothetical protein